ncbi:hypothetical protein RB614_26860 [Phytohabitans sp. ZYX-F-186]|uniref:Uncharacterized protein n=1 Tax=Phytohabitans maris TaxID=3071409 RepID=A0ABU0ZNC5_9ACTN|nr:hypothetical protein [Phytohabitans sp. ZYX-F-186]MDQ7908151.1 hypothetical protein [Phytohabitans sp. ZYX-F-186]
MSLPFPSPSDPAAGRAEVLLRYLDFFRDIVVELAGGPVGE